MVKELDGGALFCVGCGFVFAFWCRILIFVFGDGDCGFCGAVKMFLVSHNYICVLVSFLKGTVICLGRGLGLWLGARGWRRGRTVVCSLTRISVNFGPCDLVFFVGSDSFLLFFVLVVFDIRGK